jgi:hypothetical protein
VGRKRRGAGKHLYLYIAVLTVLVLSSCAAHDGAGRYGQGIPHTSHRWQHLQPVQSRIERRDFDGAARDYQAALSAPVEPRRNADLMLFDLGLLNAHYANPGKDYKKSIEWFSRLIREYPESTLAEEARIWVDILETLERTKLIDIELEEKKKAMNR